MVAEEDGGGAGDPGERGLRVAQQQLEVLRRQLVGEGQRLVEVAGDSAAMRLGCAASSRSTASTVRCASEASGVTSTARASGSCSPCATRSAATWRGSALESATIATSLGPASASMRTSPASCLFASVT
jgi:hypothetical protein